MIKQYYIVSEDELRALIDVVYVEGVNDLTPTHDSKYFAARLDAEAACRARPINTSDEYYIVSKELLRRLESRAFDYGYISGSDGPYHNKEATKYEVYQALKECFEIPYGFEE
jgi:hypothetical protein